MAYLDAEEEHGEGLSQAVPSEADSVKLMTVHRAKGLEWHTVYLPSLVDKVFPADSRDGLWPTRAHTLPATLRGDAASIPQLGEYSKKGLEAYRDALKVDHRLSEDRLAYVAATRAKTTLIASAHIWTPGTIRPRGESHYFAALRSHTEPLGAHIDAATRGADSNPIPAEPGRSAWPLQMDADVADARRTGAELVWEAAELAPDVDRDAWAWQSGTLTPHEAAVVAAWDESAAHLTALLERRLDRAVELPDGLSATNLMALRNDPESFAAALLRRMPRQPSRGARVGSRFHAWLQERFELPAALDETDVVVGAESDELAALVEAFERGQFATRVPIGVEVPFLMRHGQHVLRGRIDAVYGWNDRGFQYLVVDWKTSTKAADPLQLAVYRQAWAEARGVSPEVVAAAFYHVPSDHLRFVDAPAVLIDQAIAAGLTHE